jgi:hypothetical protein
MSTATIHIPGEHVAAIRESLEASRRDVARELDGEARAGRAREIDAVLAQLDAADADASLAVSGARQVLWHAAYDALCACAESFAADCNDLWRGRPTTEDARAALAHLERRLDLLDALGTVAAESG